MSDQNPSDRRATERRRIVRAAISTFDSLQSAIPCVLLDLSEGGARLNLSSVQDLNDEFRLTVETENIDRRCVIVWRSGDEIGVRFID